MPSFYLFPSLIRFTYSRTNTSCSAVSLNCTRLVGISPFIFFRPAPGRAPPEFALAPPPRCFLFVFFSHFLSFLLPLAILLMMCRRWQVPPTFHFSSLAYLVSRAFTFSLASSKFLLSFRISRIFLV